MGDCRIRILIDRDLLLDDRKASNEDGKKLVEKLSISLESDCTVSECLSRCLIDDSRTVWSNIRHVSIWDCTAFPTKNITESCLNDGHRTTLFSAGWFPSGTLQILSKGATTSVMASADSYQDTQYNLSESIQSEGQVTLKAADSPVLPSQLLQSVVERNTDDQVTNYETARKLRQENKVQKRLREAERAKRIDGRIESLNKKHSKTSAQVRNMLIKSRANGRSTLRQEDRIYLHCVWDTDKGEEYLFFSLQDTIGKALDTLPSTPGMELEMLVRSMSGEYRRLPSAMRFQEAVRQSYLTGQVDTIVLRQFGGVDCATTVISPPGASTPEDVDLGVSPCTEHIGEENSNAMQGQTKDNLHRDLVMCLQATKFEAKKPTTIKVRNMRMKAKAKGDLKRVGELGNRFYFELILVDETKKAKTLGFVFVGRNDPCDRILKDYMPRDSVGLWDLFSFGNDKLVKILSSNETILTWDDAERKHLVMCFDQVIWRLTNS